MIEVRNINKSFGDKTVLKNVSCLFETGKTNLVIGASGSGKSTLARCIVGLIKPDDGEILFDGREFMLMSGSERKEIRREIGFLFQASALFDYMTVEQNVKFPLDMFTNMSENEKRDRANLCLERVDLAGSNKLFPAELSGGMKKRVGIARAISANPKYLFCDEPNSGLDPQTSIVIDNLISEITKEYGMTTIVITHDMNSVLEIGERVFFIYKGELWWKGTKEDILVTENKEVLDFVYASEFMKEVRRK